MRTLNVNGRNYTLLPYRSLGMISDPTEREIAEYSLNNCGNIVFDESKQIVSDKKELAVVFSANYLFLHEAIGSYTPKERGFTSQSEVDYIAESLNLKDQDITAYSAIRDAVVAYYNHRMDELDARNTDIGREAFHEAMQSLMSVTAVIDHFIYSL